MTSGGTSSDSQSGGSQSGGINSGQSSGASDSASSGALIPGRLSTGVPGLDEALGGGLVPGTLTVALGATGIGKTQLGLQFAQAGAEQEGRRGVLFDMSSRGDSQSHRDYALRMYDWPLEVVDPGRHVDLADFYNPSRRHGEYLHVFDYHGRHVTRGDLNFEAWQEWQAELVGKLNTAIAFLYGNFLSGVRRVVVDGIEPVDRPHDSIQFSLFEYVYHQIVRKDPDWVARDLFREHFLANAELARKHSYDVAGIGCMLMMTSKEVMLEELIERPIAEGDLLSNANTILLLGKVRREGKMGRAIYIAKHRGSYCSEELLPYTISAAGLRLE